MRMTKKTLRFFTIADWEKEENYLRKMHQEGWKLKKGGIIYNFERCEPEDVIYQLDYNQEGAKIKGHMYRCSRTVVGNSFRILLDIPILEKQKKQWAKTKKPYFVIIYHD